MLEFEDLYEILQVHPSAHPGVIQASHRHFTPNCMAPVDNPYPNASEMLDAINHAYDVLNDSATIGLRTTNTGRPRAKSRTWVQSKSFQVLDDDGNVRAELGCRVVKHGDSSDTEPVLELKDSVGHVRFSVSLDYFDQPRLVMEGEEEHDERLIVALGSNGETLLLMRDEGDVEPFDSVSGGNLIMRDAEGTIRLQAGLSGGDEGDSPRLVMRDKAGRTRLEIELVEVELDRMANIAQVGDDYELSPLTFAFPPSNKDARRRKGTSASRQVCLELTTADSP